MAKHRLYSGQTLFGLMLSVSLSSFLLLVILLFYQQIQQQNREMMLRLQLQAETQRVLHLISKDIRRAGFRAVSDSISDDNFSLFTTDEGNTLVIAQGNNAKTQSCLLFFYDLDESGCLGKKTKNAACMLNDQNLTEEIERELFGYRLNQGMLETRLSYKNAVNTNCKKAECQFYLQSSACNGGGWADLLDDSKYVVTDLRFMWLIEQKAIKAYLQVALKQFPKISYESLAIIPLLNGEE